MKVFPTLQTEAGTIKYLQPRRSGLRVYFPAATLDAVLRSAAPVYVIEGEKKALAVAETGLPSIGICGIEGWRAAGSYYAELIETKAMVGPNPAADLKFFIGKHAHRRQRSGVFFAQEEGPQLLATAKALFPRWSAFMLTGLLGGLRWGESAALYKTDIDWKRSRIHVQRTFSEKAKRIEPPKDSDDRWVTASPALLAALKAHVGAVDLEGQVKDWTAEQRQLVFPFQHARPDHALRAVPRERLAAPLGEGRSSV